MKLLQSFHASFGTVHEKLLKWQTRFPAFQDDTLVNGQTLFYLVATKKYLDHRSASHLSRLILSIHLVQKKLQRAIASSPHIRHLEIQWMPAKLSFPFSTKSVMGCLIGFNLTDWYERFDEESILLLLEKSLPEIKIVTESSYYHLLPDKNLKIFYFEIEKKDLSLFSLVERDSLKNSLERQIQAGFQKLAPTVFMRRNEEEVYKTILTLNREIHSPEDIPQVWISFEKQTNDEVIFLIVLVHVSAKGRRLPLEQSFFDASNCTFISERHITVRHLQDDYSVEAQIFRLHLCRSLSLIRSDGSLDFYASRRQVIAYLNAAVGEFRDFNGGGLVKQSELLESFKERFPYYSKAESELMETFFYTITPLEKQILLKCDTLCALFGHFLNHRYKKLDQATPYIFDIHKTSDETFLAIKVCASWKDVLLRTLERPEFKTHDLTYTMIEIPEGLFLHGVIPFTQKTDDLIGLLQQAVCEQDQNVKSRQVLRIGMEHSPVSLDPRIGGDWNSGLVLQLLFEGLTRIDENGKVANGVADTIDISSDYKCYVFKLRSSLWNDGSTVTAYDFEYAWKKILSPDFKTAFANLFYPIKYAKEAKEGKVPVHAVGIYALDKNTLQVDLTHPTPYFLELTAQPLYYPVRQSVDNKIPQWPYQTEKHYPCNGPFQLAINDVNHQTYKLVKNPYYKPNSATTLDEILITHVNPYQALQAFQRKELDWIGSPFGNWYPSYVAGPEDQKVTIHNASICWFVFNTTYPPLTNAKVRQAFGYAIDRASLTSDSFLPLTPAYSILLPHQNPNPSAFFPQHDAKKARSLLQEGLDELRITIEQFKPLQLIFYQGGIRERISLHLKQQLSDFLGIECSLQPMHSSFFFPKMIEGTFQIALTNWAPRTCDPITTLSSFKHMFNWEDSKLQQWLNLSDQEVCPSKRASYLLHAEQEISKAMPIIPLFYQPFQALLHEDLHASFHSSFVLTESYYKYLTINPSRSIEKENR